MLAWLLASVLRWWLGSRGVTKARSLCSGSGISVAIRAAGTVRKPARSSVSQAPVM